MMVMKIPMAILEKFVKDRYKKAKIIAWNSLTDKQRNKVAEQQKLQQLMLQAMTGDQRALISLNKFYTEHQDEIEAEMENQNERVREMSHTSCHDCGESHCCDCQGCGKKDDDEDDDASVFTDPNIN